jgi:hypothetical protein
MNERAPLLSAHKWLTEPPKDQQDHKIKRRFTMAGQPDFGADIWKFDVAQLTVLESAGAPPAVVIKSAAGSTFTLVSELSNSGPQGFGLITPPGQAGKIQYFATRLDAPGVTQALTPRAFQMNGPTVRVSSDAFNTVAPSGTSLGPGVWQILATVSFANPAFVDVGGFNTVILQIRP